MVTAAMAATAAIAAVLAAPMLAVLAAPMLAVLAAAMLTAAAMAAIAIGAATQLLTGPVAFLAFGALMFRFFVAPSRGDAWSAIRVVGAFRVTVAGFCIAAARLVDAAAQAERRTADHQGQT
jgi:hypothetical protein